MNPYGYFAGMQIPLPISMAAAANAYPGVKPIGVQYPVN